MSQQEKEYLELFKSQSEEILSWGNSELWSNADFERLSELIFDKTGVSLSISTLKRVWGKVRYDSIPTTTTLNTLAQFAGYESWRSFCTMAEKKREKDTSTAYNPKNSAKIPGHRRLVIAGLITAVLLATVLVWMGFNNKKLLAVDGSKIVFTSKAVSDELPNSVVFNYDIGNAHADSVFIQQSWDPSRRERVPADGHQHTSIYYYPGYFKAKLVLNNTIVKEHEIFIKTKGWEGIVQPQTSRDALPVYLSARDIDMGNGELGVSTATLTAKTGKSVFNDVWSAFFNAKEYAANPDNFTFKATLQNTSSKEQAMCRQVKMNIITSDGIISLPLCAKGCISDISVRVSDVVLDGKNHDLSALGCDFSKPVSVKVQVKNRNAAIFLNDNNVLNIPYKRKFGRIVNLIVVFEGAGVIRTISVE
jgi:hypothetical protein